MYNKDKIIKASIIVGFVLLFLLSMPFFIIENPEKYHNPNDVLKEHPAVQQEYTENTATNAATTSQPAAQNIPSVQTGTSYAQIHQYAINYYNNRAYDKAVAMFQEALKIRPSQPIDLYYIALCQTKMGEFEKAEKSYESVHYSYINEKSYWYARALNAEQLQEDYYLQKAQIYINNAYNCDKSDLKILDKRAAIFQQAYNNYIRDYGRHPETIEYKKYSSLVTTAYADLLNEAQAQGNEGYVRMASASLAAMGLEGKKQRTSSAQENSNNSEINIPITQQNTGDTSADIQLIENLPVMQ